PSRGTGKQHEKEERSAKSGLGDMPYGVLVCGTGDVRRCIPPAFVVRYHAFPRAAAWRGMHFLPAITRGQPVYRLAQAARVSPPNSFDDRDSCASRSHTEKGWYGPRAIATGP